MKRFLLFFVTAFMFSQFAFASVDFLVSPEWVKGHLGDKNLVVVDVQSKPDDYNKGHIPGAVKVVRGNDLAKASGGSDNFYYPDSDKFVALMGRLGISNDSVVVAYDNKMGLFASRFVAIMEMYDHNINQLKVLDGGISAWKRSGYSIEAGDFKESDKKVTYKISKVRNITVKKESPLRAIKDRHAMIVDARPKSEYNGENKRANRAGFIPTAINVTGTDVINNPDQTYKSIEDIKKAFESAGVTPDKDIYVYCHSGDRSAQVYLVLTAMLGYKNVKIYDGSFFEWANTETLPLDTVK